MSLFDEIYQACNRQNYFNRRIPPKKIREAKEEENYEYDIKDGLISHLEIEMIKIILDYKACGIDKSQMLKCIDEACDIVKRDIKNGLF